MKNSIAFFILLRIANFSYGQDTFSISGSVTSVEQGTPLAFATIGIGGSPYGTVSNADGEFLVIIPYEHENDTLSVSYVGFKTAKIRIKEALQRSTLNVELTERIIALKQVEVNAEKLTAKQIIDRAIVKVEENFPQDPFIMRGFFRDIRTQNSKTVYLVEAALDVWDHGISLSKDLPKKFFLRSVRASETRVHNLLWGSLLNSGNSLSVNLAHNFWLNRLKFSADKSEYQIEDLTSIDDKYLYVISTEQIVSMSDLAEQYKDMKFRMIHKYHIDAETFAIHKVQHLEEPLEGPYIGKERPYEGDTLFYSKKGWNQTTEFEEFNGKMYLKYHDVTYAFDIVDEKNNAIFLDMAYQFSFIATDIREGKEIKPEGEKMNRMKPLTLQAGVYDESFWNDESNAKLVPLTKRQITELEEEQPLSVQFRSKKKKLKRSR